MLAHPENPFGMEADWVCSMMLSDEYELPELTDRVEMRFSLQLFRRVSLRGVSGDKTPCHRQARLFASPSRVGVEE